MGILAHRDIILNSTSTKFVVISKHIGFQLHNYRKPVQRHNTQVHNAFFFFFLRCIFHKITSNVMGVLFDWLLMKTRKKKKEVHCSDMCYASVKLHKLNVQWLCFFGACAAVKWWSNRKLMHSFIHVSAVTLNHEEIKKPSLPKSFATKSIPSTSGLMGVLTLSPGGLTVSPGGSVF